MISNLAAKTSLNRDWDTYLIKAVFESAASGANNPDLPCDSEAQFFLLPNPLITDLEIRKIGDIERGAIKGKVYPPFALNEKDRMAAYVHKAKYPQGSSLVESYIEIPESAVKGVTYEPGISNRTKLCHAIRIDANGSFARHELFKQLLEHITQYTYQWWLRSPSTPFRGPAFLGAFIDQEFKVLKDSKQPTQSAWHGIVQAQKLLGLEVPLDENRWSRCIQNVANNVPAEMGLLTFADAIAHYMSGDDRRSLLDLTICFEILANKRLFADGKKMQTSKDKLLKETTLVGDQTKVILSKLLIDRDHVAHGRDPYIINKDPSMMDNYFKAIQTVINNYIASLKDNQFHELSAVKLGDKPQK